MRIIHSTIEAAVIDRDDQDSYRDAVADDDVIRESATMTDVPAYRGAFVLYVDPQTGSTRWALDWYDPAEAGCEDADNRREAEAAYEQHVREMAKVGWSWDETDADTVTTCPT